MMGVKLHSRVNARFRKLMHIRFCGFMVIESNGSVGVRLHRLMGLRLNGWVDSRLLRRFRGFPGLSLCLRRVMDIRFCGLMCVSLCRLIYIIFRDSWASFSAG